MKRAISFAALLCACAAGFAQEADDAVGSETAGAASAAVAPSTEGPAANEPSETTDAAPALAQTRTQSSEGRVMDRLDLGTTSITGNQELPKVLYIVPWKRSDLGDLVGRPVNRLLDEVLAPIDPVVFERHLSYYETLYGEGQQE